MPVFSPLAVLLAAGASKRMGRPKATLDWFGRPLLSAHLDALPCPVHVVVAAPFEGIVLPPNASWIVNPSAATSSMGDSAVLGCAGHRGPVLFIPVDTVPQPALIHRLLACAGTTVPTDADGRRGHPVWVSPADVDRLRGLPEPNLRVVVQRAALLATTDPTCALDFDTPEALRRTKEVVRVARGGLEPPTPRV